MRQFLNLVKYLKVKDQGKKIMRKINIKYSTIRVIKLKRIGITQMAALM
jgi:hypothetical protein